MKKILHKLVFTAVLAVIGPIAHAQWSVFDPTNFVQNYTQAASGLKTEINTAQTLIQQTNAAIDMAKSVKRLTNLDSLADVQTALRLYKELKAVDGKIDRDFQEVTSITDRLGAQYGASEFSWSQFLASRDQLNKKQRESAAQRYAAVNASLEQNARQRQVIVEQLGTVQGQTEAMQTLGAAVDVLIGQNQQIISILSNNNKVNDINDMKRDAGNSAADAAYRQYQERLRQAASKYSK